MVTLSFCRIICDSASSPNNQVPETGHGLGASVPETVKLYGPLGLDELKVPEMVSVNPV